MQSCFPNTARCSRNIAFRGFARPCKDFIQLVSFNYSWFSLRSRFQGYLDLSGRHQARYVSLLIRWTDCIRGMEQISSVLLPPKPPYSASLADEKDDDLLHIQPGSEDLVRAFGKKWRFEAMSKSMILYISGLFRAYNAQSRVRICEI